MLEENNTRRTVHQCSPSEARKTLGVHIAPDGNMNSQIEAMLSASEAFSTKLKHSRLSGCDALHSFNTRIMKTLTYPLPTSMLTEVDCNKIMSPTIHSVLGKAKIVRSIKRDVLYGPLQYQGFGLTNLHVCQGSMQLAQLVQFCNTNTELGKIHNITLQNLILEVGLTGVPFQHDYAVLHNCATDSQMKHIWKFCYTQHQNTLNNKPSQTV